jgi:hypothetical protein
MARGVGTHLKDLIHGLLGVKTGGCGGCKQLLEDMDSKGAQWVRDNIAKIAPQIRNNAKKNKDWRARIAAHIPGVNRPIVALVFLAIKRHEDEVATEKAQAEKTEEGQQA